MEDNSSQTSGVLIAILVVVFLVIGGILNYLNIIPLSQNVPEIFSFLPHKTEAPIPPPKPTSPPVIAYRPRVNTVALTPAAQSNTDTNLENYGTTGTIESISKSGTNYIVTLTEDTTSPFVIPSETTVIRLPVNQNPSVKPSPTRLSLGILKKGDRIQIYEMYSPQLGKSQILYVQIVPDGFAQ